MSFKVDQNVFINTFSVLCTQSERIHQNISYHGTIFRMVTTTPSLLALTPPTRLQAMAATARRTDTVV